MDGGFYDDMNDTIDSLLNSLKNTMEELVNHRLKPQNPVNKEYADDLATFIRNLQNFINNLKAEQKLRDGWQRKIKGLFII